MENKLSFLIVDDDNDDRDFFCEAVEEIYPGSVCLRAENGKDCLRLLGRTGTVLPNFIFLDLNMPLMDGKTCLAELKRNGGLMNIPVVIYTTSNHRTDREETDKLGSAYYLVKPTSYKGLCEGIKGAIEAVREMKVFKNKTKIPVLNSHGEAKGRVRTLSDI